MEFHKGENPRVRCSKHRERGLKQFTYDYAMLEELLGLSVKTLQSYAALNIFDPEDLKSIVEFFVSRKKKLQEGQDGVSAKG